MQKPGEASVSSRIMVLDQVLAARLEGTQVTCQAPSPLPPPPSIISQD